jgi:hypothetical protein
MRILYEGPQFSAGVVLEMAVVGEADTSAQTHHHKKNAPKFAI